MMSINLLHVAAFVVVGTMFAGTESTVPFRQQVTATLNKLEQDNKRPEGMSQNVFMKEIGAIVNKAINQKDVFSPNSDFNIIIEQSSGSFVKDMSFSYSLKLLIRKAGATASDDFKSQCVTLVVNNILSVSRQDSACNLIFDLLSQVKGRNHYTPQVKQKIKSFLMTEKTLHVAHALLAEKAGLFEDEEFVKFLNDMAASCHKFDYAKRKPWVALVFLARHNNQQALDRILKIAAAKQFDVSMSDNERWRKQWMLCYLILIRNSEVIELMKEYLNSDVKYKLGEDTPTVYLARIAADVLYGLVDGFPKVPNKYDKTDLRKDREIWLNALKNGRSVKLKEERFWDYRSPSGPIYSWLFSEG